MRPRSTIHVAAVLLVWTALYVQRAHAQDLDGPDPHAYKHEQSESIDSDESLIGYTPEEGFRMRSRDGDYLLRIGFQAGFKLEPSWTDGDRRMNGTFSFLRPILRGNLFRPWVLYRLSMELAGEDPRVFDAHFDIEPWEEFGLRFGQQGTPVSRHESFGPQQLFFPEFAAVANYFWSGRERGLTVYGSVIGERLDYYAGVYSGSPIDEPVNLEDNYVVEGRVTVNPLGPVNENEYPMTPDGEPLPLRVSFTLQGFYGRLQTVNESYNPSYGVLSPNAALETSRLGMLGGDLWFQSGPVIVFGEFYWRRQRLVDGGDWYGAMGAWGQAIVNVYRNILGAGVRVSWIEPNTELSHDNSYELEGQVAWLIRPPQLALKLRYAWLKQQAPDEAELGEFVLPYVEGTTHVVTLQLTLAF